jgi:rare lipoprotein A (peptidoglycan hydrolase)
MKLFAWGERQAGYYGMTKAFLSSCIFILFIAAVFPGCAAPSVMAKRSGNTGSIGPREGIASYYAKKFHGRKTANGERFDTHKFTAAHRTLPFGTRVKVTNIRNGRSVVVRINDRGPYKHDRLIDVSYVAAKEIGIVRRGKGRVRIEVLR